MRRVRSGVRMSAAGIRRDTRIRTRTSEPTFAVFEAAVDRRPTCDGCKAPATWRGATRPRPCKRASIRTVATCCRRR